MTSLETLLYQMASPAQAERMTLVSSMFCEVNKAVSGICPDSNTKSLSLAYLEDSRILAIQSIVREGQAIAIVK